MPIVLISGDAGRVDSAEAGSLGIQGFVDKPASVEELQQALSQAILTKPSECPSPDGTKLQILIVDDDNLVLDSLATTLETIGCNSHTARNMQQAEEILSSHEFDVVLVDRKVNQEDGFKSVRMLFKNDIQANQRRPRLVGMTGSETPEDEEEYFLDAYLTKPFTHEELKQALCLPKSE